MAGSKNDDFECNWLKGIFWGTSLFSTLLASGTATKFWLSLHTSGTGLESGGQNTNEADYGSYARVVIDRTSGSWSIVSGTTNTAAPTTQVSFPASTTSGTTLTAFAVGTASAGAGTVYYWGDLTPTIAINGSGVTPILTTGTTIEEQ